MNARANPVGDTLAADEERAVAGWYLYDRRAPVSASLVSARDFVAVPQLGPMWAVVEAHSAKKLDWGPLDLGPYDVVNDLLGSRLPLPERTVHRAEEAMVRRSVLRRTGESLRSLLEDLRGGADLEHVVRVLRETTGQAEARRAIESRTFRELAEAEATQWAAGPDGVQSATIPMPWPTLQRELGGWQRGKVHIVLAVTSGHKTTVAKEAAMHAAELGYRVLYWSIDDKARDIVRRVLASRVPGLTLSQLALGRGDESPAELYRIIGGLTEVVSRQPELEFRLLDKKKPLLREVEGVVRRHAALGLDLVVLDYVQMIRPNERATDKRDHYEEVAAAMQQLANDLDIAILLPAQTSQVGTSKVTEGKRLGLADIRGSSTWAQDAYGVLVLHGPTPKDPDRLTVLVRKWKDQRKGIEVVLELDGAHNRLTEMS